ncbi:hypothetical protein B566_EDAN012941, partial [Ephemera danica]
MLIQEPVQAAIWHCLNHYDYNDATFLAERLAAEVNSEESYFLLATCYYRSGKPSQAYDLLQRKGAESPQSKFLLAKCCLGLHKLLIRQRNMLIQEPVQAAIWHCLNHYDYTDATFLAERLAAEVNSEESYFLLATCYYRSGKPSQAYDLLQRKGAESPQSKFLLAKCCLGLHKLPEAENILSAKESWERKHTPVPLDEVVKEFGDLACFALQLLARICAQTKRQARAAEAYRKSLHLNPFLWCSFEELCAQGEKPDPAKTFELGHVENFNTCVGSTQMVACPQPLNTASSSLSATAPEFCTPTDANIMISTPVFPLSGSALAAPLDHTPVSSGGAGIV